MTATLMPGLGSAALRPVGWQRLLWVAWRRHRSAVAAVVALLAGISVYVVIVGLRTRDAYDAAQSCHPASSAACTFGMQEFQQANAHHVLATLLMFVPGLIGTFCGAPILARELEAGTFRYAWTQGVGRVRWTVAMLVPPAVVLVALGWAFSVLVGWTYQPLFDSAGASRLDPPMFVLLGVAFAAWTLLAFALGALAGILLRRVVPAVVAALAVWAGLMALTATQLRPHYGAPVVTSSMTGDLRDWTLSQHWAKGGSPVGDAELNRVLSAIGVHVTNGGYAAHVEAGQKPPQDPVTYLLQHGYRQLTTYQPHERFWTFQWIEGGWLLLLAVVLLGLTVWFVRRRAA